MKKKHSKKGSAKRNISKGGRHAQHVKMKSAKRKKRAKILTVQRRTTAKKKMSLLAELKAENKKLETKVAHKVKTDNAIQTASQALPISYNQTRFVLMVRDPYWVYAYWDLSDEKQKEIELYLREKNNKAKSVLRIYDITETDVRRDTARNYFDIEVPVDVGQWYVYLGLPDRKFIADFGFVDQEGDFYLFAWSNAITMPRDTPSSVVDAQCALLDEEFD